MSDTTVSSKGKSDSWRSLASNGDVLNPQKDIDARLHSGLPGSVSRDTFQLITPTLSNGRSNGMSYEGYDSRSLDDDEMSVDDEVSEIAPFDLTSDLTDSDRFLLHSGVEEDGFDFNQIDQETRSKLELLLPGIFCEESLDPSFMQNLQSSLAKYIEEADLKELVHNLPIDKVDSNLLMKLHEETLEQNDYEFTNTFIKACGAGHIEIIKSLVNDYCKIDLDAKGTNGETTALMEACIGGYYDVVEYILQRNASPKIKSSSGNTALHYAALGGHADICELLLNYGANIEETNENGHTALMEAASAGHVNVAEVLLDHGAGINAHSNEFKESALTLASYKGHYDMVKFLLQRGADKQHKTDEMHTALMEACMDGHVEVARLLLDHGAEVNMPPDSFESPLTLAACGGHIELAQLLIERGANLEEMNDEGYTPLMEAAREGHDAMASLLIDSGANVNTITEETQETALTLACCGGSIEVVKLLLNDCADPNLGGSTPLMEAAQEGHLEIVLYLLQNGAIPDAVTNSGDTALSYACENGHTEVLEVLIDAGCDVNRADPETGRTPLMRAARAGHLKTVEKLIASGARINEATLNNDQTALSLACAGGHVQVAQCLIQNGADVGYILHDNSNCLIETARGGHAIVAQLLLHSAKEIIDDSSIHENRQNCEKVGSDFFCSGSLPHNTDFGEGSNKYDKYSDFDDYVQFKKNECCMGDLSSSLVEQLGRIAPERMLDALKRPITQDCTETDGRLIENLEYVFDKSSTLLTPESIPYETSEKLGSIIHQGSEQDNSENENDEQLSQKKILLEKLQKAEKELHEKARVHLRLDPKSEHKPLCMTSKMRSTNVQSEQWGVYLPQCSNIESVEPSNTEIASLLNSNVAHLSSYNSCIQNINNGTGRLLHGEEDSNETNSSNADIVQHLVDGIKSFTEENEKQSHLNTDTKKALEHLRELAQNPVTAVDQIKLLSAAAAAAASVIPGENQRDESFLRELHKIASNTAAMEAQMKLTKGNKVDCVMCRHSNSVPTANTNAIGCQVVFSPPTVVNEQVDSNSATKVKDSFVPRSLKLDLLKNFENAQTMLKDLEEKHQASLQTKRGHSKESQQTSQSSCTADLIPENANSSMMNSNPTSNTRKKKYLSSSVLNVNAATESNHDTALTLACSGGHEELVLMLLREGADIEHKDKKGYTPLILSATAGHVNIVQLLIDHGADIEAQSEKTKDTALSLACSSGKCDTVELLLSKGANKEHRNVSDYTPLSLAASGGFINIINLLLSYGAEINSRTNSKLGISPLMLAAMNGHMNAVKLLLDMGADINAQIETNRNTALTLACYQGRAEVVSLLVDRKANIEHRAKTGLTPLMEAASGGYVEVGKVLIEKGADVNAAPVPSSRDTALTIAADKGHSKFIELLLDNMASIDMRNKKSATPLWLASHGGHLEAVQTLVMRGAHPDSEDSRKVSCLMAAFKKGHVKVVKYLVKYVRQFPSDSDCIKYIAQITDKELLKKCNQCMDIIMAAKDHQTQEADKAANSLLEELDLEKFREESKRQAAAKKREKRKLKRQIKKNQKPANVNNEDTDNNSDREISEQTVSAKTSSTNVRESETSLKIRQAQSQVHHFNAATGKVSESKNLKPESDADGNMKTTQHKFSNNSKSKKKRKSVKERTRTFEEKNKSVDASKEKGSANTNESKEEKSFKLNDSSNPPSADSSRVPVSNDTVVHSQNHSNATKSFVDSHATANRENLKTGTGRRKTGKKNFEEGWTEVVGKQKRIQVTQEHLQRVTGRAGCNLSSIREVTGAQVELENKKASNGEQVIIIKGSAESIKHAYQLIQALINNSDSDLLNLLPSNLKCKVSSFSDSVIAASSSSTQESCKVTTVAYSRSSGYANHLHTVAPRFQQMKQSFPSIADIDMFPALGPGRVNKTSGYNKALRTSNASADVNKRSIESMKTSVPLITTSSCSSSNVWVNSNRSKSYMNSHNKGRTSNDPCDVFTYSDASLNEVKKNTSDNSRMYSPFSASVPFSNKATMNSTDDDENKQHRMFSDVARALNTRSTKNDDIAKADVDDATEVDVSKAPGYRRTQSNAGSFGILKVPEVSRALSVSSNPEFLKSSSLFKISKSESSKTPVESILENADQNKTEFVNSHFFVNDQLTESASFSYTQPMLPLVSSNVSGGNVDFSQLSSSLNPNAPDFQIKHPVYTNMNQHYSCPVSNDIAANLLRLTQLNIGQRQPTFAPTLMSNQNLSSFNPGNNFVHPLVQSLGRQLSDVQSHNPDCVTGSHALNSPHFNSISNSTIIPNSCLHRPISQHFPANWNSTYSPTSELHRTQLQQRYMANRMMGVCQNPQGVIWRPDNLVMNQDGFLPPNYYGLNGISAPRLPVHVSPLNDVLANKIYPESSALTNEKLSFTMKHPVEPEKLNVHEKEHIALRGQTLENNSDVEASKTSKTVGVIGGERKRMTDASWNRPDLQRRTSIPYPTQVSSVYRPLLSRYETPDYTQSLLNQNWMPSIM